MRSRFVGLGGRLKNSFIDYPGTVATVLFFSGCNLRCPYCHNKILVNSGTDQSMLSDQIWDFLDARRGTIEGVVLSGGEPTLYPCLAHVIPEIRALGYKIKLDTNGLLPEIAGTFAPDYLALDIKTIPSRYGALLSAACDDIEGRLRRSLELVSRMGERAEVRITIAPGLVDIEVIRQLLPLLSGIHRVVLQPMDQSAELLNPDYNTIPPIPMEEIEQMRSLLAGTVGACSIRGHAT